MAETNATPTSAEVYAIRSDVSNYIETETLVFFTSAALVKFKIDLLNVRGVKFAQVFDTTNDLYFINTDDETNNDDQCINLLSHLTVALVFQDYAIKVSDSQWMDLSDRYRAEYDDLLKIARLDVDLDDSGDISAGEEGRSGQTFFRR